ncbi:lipopolysaccharide biosynthesis protein [Metapseudomonas boanensis]|uniref:Lipopolysaccharide biosynthesis protein n=1 Tax=Metapseudomonas boanensis TaxID=2822138 RepID=A0ABS5XHF8_9GAMM|nr:lipopolysaccharide biosynthesis protein [Pseudomonas boanensis]MBT8765767.1 lipopolysaccharide biosynthesis protein [Pseudomonas boanensis]
MNKGAEKQGEGKIIDNFLLRLPTINERDARLIKSAAFSLLSKSVGIIVAIITIPLTSGYLSKELFGLWMLITGVLATLTFVDLGIGIGLQNGISKSLGLNTPKIAINYIKSAYTTITITTLGIATLTSLLLYTAGLDGVIKATEILDTDTRLALVLGCYLYLAGIPASLIHRILNGYQENHTTNILIIYGSLLSLTGIYTSVALDLGFPGILLSFIASPIIVNIIYSLYFFSKKNAFETTGNIERSIVQKLLKDGGWSLLAQALFAIKTNSPPIIIGVVSGVISVGEYGVTQKVVSVFGLMVAVALQPLWSAYGEAYHRKDKQWIIKTLKRSTSLVLLITVPAFVFLIIFAQDIIEHWLKSPPPQIGLVGSLSLWVIISNLNVCFAMFLNGIGAFRRQSMISLLFISASIVTSYYSGLTWGDTGAVIGFILLAELARMPFLANEVRREIRGMTG